MGIEQSKEKELERFQVWYNHDGVKRAADVRYVEADGQKYYKCRLFNDSEIEIESITEEDEGVGWKLLLGGITTLSERLGLAIEARNTRDISKDNFLTKPAR